jgi:hypothetical protein
MAKKDRTNAMGRTIKGAKRRPWESRSIKPKIVPGAEAVKVYVEPRLDDGEVKYEGLWAEPVGEALYKVWNLPAFLKGLNFMDVVRCQVRADVLLVVEAVVTQSGHRTVWITFDRRRSVEGPVQALLDGTQRIPQSVRRLTQRGN